jgi:hypothetical protein
MANQRPAVRFLQVLLALFAAASAPAWSQSESEPDLRQQQLIEDPVNRMLGEQNYYDMWLFLSRSRTDWIRTSAAIFLYRGFGVDPGPDPELRGMGERLMTEILASKPREPHALWLLLKFCTADPGFPGCASNDFQQRVIESDPDNAAVYLVPVTLWDFSNLPVLADNEENRRALLRASHAHRFDDYYGRDLLQVYRELSVFAERYPVNHEPAMDQSASARAGSYAWTVMMMEPQLAFGALYDLCEAQAVAERMDTADACLSVARTMQKTARTLLVRTLGYGLERRVSYALDGDEATALYLRRKARMSTEATVCQLPSWMTGAVTEPEIEESAVLEYLADLDAEGEIAAIRNAGAREFEAHPERFEQDPARCGELMDLDSEAMGAALGELDPALQQQ